MVTHKNKSSNTKAFGLILWQLLFTGAAIYLSFYGDALLWFGGQILLAVNLFQWFVLHHDLVHDSLFRTKFLNTIFGHLSSIPTLMPYHSFKLSHHQHHIWTGWRDKDPTSPQMYLKQPPSWAIKVVNFCWKFWIPLMAPLFVLQNFWGLNRLFRTFPKATDKRNVLFSMFVIIVTYSILFILLPAIMLKVWLLSFFMFLLISDLVLMSQHTHIDGHFANENEVKAFRYSDQTKFTRTIVYPKFVSRFIFYHFDKHAVHHQYPGVPTYYLGNLPVPKELNIGWWEWLKKAKSLSAYELIYSSPSESGVNL